MKIVVTGGNGYIGKALKRRIENSDELEGSFITIDEEEGFIHTDFSVDFPEGKKHFTYTGFSYYVGLGVERDLSEHFSLGLEARYNGNKFYDSATRGNGDHVVVYPRANFLSVLLRVIYKI